MSPSIESFNSLARAWAELAWAVTWQSALLVGVFALIALGLRRSSPSLRYWLWQIVAIKLLVMPLWGIAIVLPARPQDNSAARSERHSKAQPAGESGAGPADWPGRLDRGATDGDLPRAARFKRPWIAQIDGSAWLLLGWGLTVVGQVLAIAHQRRRLERLLRRATLASDPALLSLVAELYQRLGLRAVPKTLIVEEAGSPFVCGLIRPTLVLPQGLACSLAPESLRSVLLHELAHVRRRDLLWDWIPTIARVVYWFHPAAHYVADRARLERELACDQAAMVFAGQDAAGYASTLVDVVSRSSQASGEGTGYLFRRLPS